MSSVNEMNGKRLSRRDFLRAAAITGAALAAASCGVSTGGGSQPKQESKTGGGKDVLKIGVLLPYSGVYAVLGESITNGMNLYFDSVGGTIAGRKIELIKEDEENEPQVGLRKARKLVEQDKVDLTTGLVNSAIAYAVRDYVDAQKAILIVSNAGANGLTREKKSKYIFRTSFTSWQPNHPMGEWIYKNVAKKVAVSAADYAAGHEMIDAFKETFLAAGGKIVAEVYPKLGTNDYAPFLTQLAKAKPEAVYSFYSGSDAVRFVKQFEEYGLKKDIKLAGAGFMLEEDVLPAQGKAALDGYSGLHWAISLDNPENKKFTEDYQKKYGKPANVFAMQGYDTARVIVEAIAKLQGDTSNKDKLIDAIVSIKFNSPRGPFSFDPETHNVIQNVYARQVKEKDGKLGNVVIAKFENVRDPGR